jgi:NAD(P)H-dependent FMN reductase
MFKIVIISSSVRQERASNRVALYLNNYSGEHGLAETEILDLETYNFPLFDERLKYQKNPSVKVMEYAEKIRTADGVIIVAPEYNGGYPASLKNVIDLLTDEWFKKPVAIATVSSGSFAGTQMVTSLQFVLWKIKALTVNAIFPVAKVKESFDEHGTAADKQGTDKRAALFFRELLWTIEAKAGMKS